MFAGLQVCRLQVTIPSQLATRNSQLATRNSQLATRTIGLTTIWIVRSCIEIDTFVKAW
jgi:hypothetical protein